MDPLQFNWVTSSLQIKEEVPEGMTTLLSPPATPNSLVLPLPSPLPSRSSRRASFTSTTRNSRLRPYPQTKPTSQSMSQGQYAMWQNNGIQSNRPMSSAERRFPSEGEQQRMFSSNSSLADHAFLMTTNQGSNMMSVMGEAPESSYSGRVPPLYSTNGQMVWPNDVNLMSGPDTTTYRGVAAPSHSFSLPPTPGYSQPAARNVSPESGFFPTEGYMDQVQRASSTSSGSQSPYNRHGEDPETENRRLRREVEGLRRALADVRTPQTSANFRAAWKRRTDARKKLFCSLNRAGNALCAWHDSRRERRQYPPRNAPPGFLNCGCSHEEALFEDTLSRHNVGGYLPGESVRMDPELRRPLLKLLEQRYGYKDGAFDYNPHTMTWNHDQEPEYWERQLQNGGRARRADHERH